MVRKAISLSAPLANFWLHQAVRRPIIIVVALFELHFPFHSNLHYSRMLFFIGSCQYNINIITRNENDSLKTKHLRVYNYEYVTRVSILELRFHRYRWKNNVFSFSTRTYTNSYIIMY